MDAIGPYEVFIAAKMLSAAEIDVNFVSAEGARTVKSGMNGPGRRRGEKSISVTEIS